MKKKRILFLVVGLLVVGLLAVYWLYMETDSLPQDEDLLSGINSTVQNVQAIEIQDFIKVDSRHGVAPFRSDSGGYGISYWKRNITGWKVKRIRTNGEPKVWMVDEDDPSSFRIVWNMAPGNHIQTLQFYFMRDRGFSISGGQQHYVPSILMNSEVSMKGTSYGMMKLPKEWVYAMKLSNGSEGQADSFWDEFDLGMFSTFGWIPLAANGKEADLMEHMNSYGYTNGNFHEEHMQRLSKEQLEQGIY
ncbi:hypothetical protein [Rossellomorea sp. NPDC077527]|uniref:hypothetical protein n=1 Tax=Rossellomorea sp. NPDC077527 TaxID=3364510 RepID=UPI0037CB68FB